MQFGYDKHLEFSKNQKVTATAASENTIEFAQVCTAGGMAVDIRVTETFTGGTSLKIALEDSENGTSWTERAATAVLLAAQLVKSGANNPLLKLVIPHNLKKNIRLNYTVSGTFTAGAVSAILNTHTL